MAEMLDILAGPAALARLRERGLKTTDIDMVVGASGGPKWLVLSGLDRVLFDWLTPAATDKSLTLLGSSIGSWQLACLAQRDPVAALERFEAAYIEQRYSPHPLPAEITRVSRGLLEVLLGENGAAEILGNPRMALHIITARSRGLSRREGRGPQLTGMILAALGNVISRRTLAWHAERAVFSTPGAALPFSPPGDFPTQQIELSVNNLAPAVLASGSIPLVLEGVEVPDAPPGIYRDGGILDYHPHLPFADGDGLILYPHFYPYAIPGWFDKFLPWRKADGRHFDRVVMLAPNAEFVASLPGGRIPDRKDFYRYSDAERMTAWRAVCDASRRLGDEFAELVATGRWAERVRPLRP